MEAGGRRATAVHVACRGVLVCRLGAEHGEERTLNMLSMSVTLEVSKLSGWLTLYASCGESKGRAYGAGRGCGPADGGDGFQRAVEARLQIRGRTGVERTWNIWYMFVTPEVSQFETSALKFCKL